jgi:hypothetical protein
MIYLEVREVSPLCHLAFFNLLSLELLVQLLHVVSNSLCLASDKLVSLVLLSGETLLRSLESAMVT